MIIAPNIYFCLFPIDRLSSKKVTTNPKVMYAKAITIFTVFNTNILFTYSLLMKNGYLNWKTIGKLYCTLTALPFCFPGDQLGLFFTTLRASSSHP